MKYKNKYDIVDRTCVLFVNNVVDMLKVLSRDTQIKYVPEKFTELLNHIKHIIELMKSTLKQDY